MGCSTSVADTVTGVESGASSTSAQSFVATAMTAAAAASSSMMTWPAAEAAKTAMGSMGQKYGSIFVLGRNFRRAAAAPPQARAARPGA